MDGFLITFWPWHSSLNAQTVLPWGNPTHFSIGKRPRHTGILPASEHPTSSSAPMFALTWRDANVQDARLGYVHTSDFARLLTTWRKLSVESWKPKLANYPRAYWAIRADG